MSAELHSTSVDLGGLLEVLGKNLYSSPAVALRELVQNAHDACVRRRIEAPDPFEPQIHLTIDSARNTLVLEDNGSGLTRDEVMKYLATIGAGYTRLLRDANDDTGAIGYFGLGFLSAYVVASQVEVWTTSYQEPEQGWYFTSNGGQRFAVEAAPARAIGTRVRLKLRDEFSDLALERTLSQLIRRYCLLMPVPIVLTNIRAVLNEIDVPWLAAPDEPEVRRTRQRLAFATLFDERFEPICAWDLPLESVEDPTPPPMPGVRGVFWIQDGAGYSTSDYRSVSVFVRNMFITDQCRELLPSWAGFVGLVLESDDLSPTASREDIQRNERFSEVQAVVHEALVDGLRAVASANPEAWRRILRRHNQALRGAAVTDSRLFEVLQAGLELPTTLGEMPVQRLLSRSGGVLYLRTDEHNAHEELLLKVRGIPVILGYRYAAATFARKYARVHALPLVELGSRAGSEVLFPAEPVGEEVEARLRERLLEADEDLLISRFEPASLPLVFVEDKEARLKRLIEADSADERIGSAALALARLHTATVERIGIRRAVVNMDNPLIERIASAEVLSPSAGSVIAVLRAWLLTVSIDVSDDEIDVAQQMGVLLTNLNHLLGPDAL